MKYLDELEAAAKRATPGPWEILLPFQDSATDAVTLSPGYWFSPGHYPKCFIDEHGEDQPKRDAAFIALANPQTILSLIEKLRVAERALEEISTGLQGAFRAADVLDLTPARLKRIAEAQEKLERAAEDCLPVMPGEGGDHLEVALAELQKAREIK